MSEFHWTENSKAVFDACLKTAPPGFRAVTEKNLVNALTKSVGDGGEVSEKDVVRVMREATPAPFLAQGLRAVEPYLTDPSALER